MTSSPPGIASYLKAAREAELGSVEEHKAFLPHAEELDRLFRALCTGRSHFKEPIAGFLGISSHANYLAAISCALRGQSPQTFMILRGCVESAMYAYLIGLNREEANIWIKRREDPAKAKATFTANRTIQKLVSRDPNLAAMLKDTYQWMIEFGGHPNPRSIIDHIRPKQADADGNHPFSFVYIQSSDSGAALRALAACIENGCMAVALLAHTVQDHPEGASIFNSIWPIFHGFQKQMEEAGYIPAVQP